MRLGIAIEETWGFFNEIYADLCELHQTTLFKRREVQLPFFRERFNRYLFNHDLRQLLETNDVVFFEWASHLLAAATQLPKSSGIATRLHRYEMYEWADRINWEAVDKVVLVSEAKRQEFITRFPDQASKATVIRVGISMDKFQPKTGAFQGNIGILCHLTPRKRVYELILTFYELLQRTNGLHLHIGGSPKPSQVDYYFAMQDLVEKLNLMDKVTFWGHVTDTWEWYHQIDIFVSNSYSEGLQVALMEAMASGCYCVSHRWGGVDELLPQENLYYTDNELQEKILAYCEAAETDRQREQARLRAIVCEEYDIDQTKVQFRHMISEVGAAAVSRRENRS